MIFYYIILNCVMLFYILCIYMHYIHKAFSKTVTQRLNFANILPADGQNWIHDVVSHGHLNRADIHVDIDFHMSTQPSTSPKCLSCQAPEWCPIFESLKCSSRHNSPHGFVLKVSHPIFFCKKHGMNKHNPTCDCSIRR